jgi:uracil-DNA glycosylase
LTNVVPSWGRQPNDVLLVGEAPGREEWARKRPFVGKSGEAQNAYLVRYGVSANGWRMANVVPEYFEGNPDPTPELIERWTPALLAEVRATRPKLVAAIGRFAMRWFLGEAAELDTCYGLAHHAGAFDPSRADRACGAIVVPLIHVAAGFHDGDAMAPIAAGYARLADIYKRLVAGQPIDIRNDEWAGREQYYDASGHEFASAMRSVRNGGTKVIGLDTEGTIIDPWSLQISLAPGTGLCLRRSRTDFKAGVEALQRAVNRGALVVLHNGMFDIGMCRALGLDLTRARLFDSMYAAYLLRLEPQGLKSLAWRWLGMRMAGYEETVGTAARERQIDYLCNVLTHQWPKPASRVIITNDGQPKLYTPQSVERRVKDMLVDIYADDSVDPYARWGDMDEQLKAEVENAIGPMATGSLADLPLADAVYYSTRDADATRRLYFKLKDELARLNLTQLMDQGMAVLPAFEQMQHTGLPASRKAFEKLRDDMTDGMERLQARISKLYYGGQPFNPKSPPQVASILRRRGLEPAKRTSTGAMSTGKASIEHLRYSDPAVADIIEWREHQHTRDMFAVPVLDLMK